MANHPYGTGPSLAGTQDPPCRAMPHLRAVEGTGSRINSRQAAETWSFPFRLDPDRRLLHGPDGRAIELRPKSFAVLQVLLSRAGCLVSRAELLDAVWGGVFVTDDSVTQCMVEIRRAVGPAGGIIRTVPRGGYILEPAPQPSQRPELPLALLPFEANGEDLPAGIGAALAAELSVELLWRGGLRLVAAPSPGGRTPGPRLGAHHLLRGSLWRQEGRSRIVAQLLDGATGELLWAERFDATGDASLPVQDELVARLAAGVLRALGREAEWEAPARSDRVVTLRPRR